MMRWLPINDEITLQLELGPRVLNALVEENDPDPSINWPIWVEMAYQKACAS